MLVARLATAEFQRMRNEALSHFRFGFLRLRLADQLPWPTPRFASRCKAEISAFKAASVLRKMNMSSSSSGTFRSDDDVLALVPVDCN